jgi:hypothetical protein
MKIEYAVTRGEGALLAYGVADYVEVSKLGIEVPKDGPSWEVDLWDSRCTVIARHCADDCETGK